MTTAILAPDVAVQPKAIGKVVLTVHDLDSVGDFYQRTLGLHRLASDANNLRLGAGDATLLELRRDSGARKRSPREAGLFHTAFLLPTRADLGRWVGHAAASRAPVVGASDHLVSEAIYLADPEGNGVEIYSDRPKEAWHWQDGPDGMRTVEMRTDALDIDDLLHAGAGGSWLGFPEGSRVGHVHLQVGAIAPAEAFYAAELGLGITRRSPGATFFAAAGYHHHIATNIWNSRGAPVRDMPSTGLSEVEVLVAGPANALVDPWGTPVTLVPMPV